MWPRAPLFPLETRVLSAEYVELQALQQLDEQRSTCRGKTMGLRGWPGYSDPFSRRYQV